MASVAEKIKEFRKSAGLTQKELAEKCGLATGTIQQYESEKRNPKKKNLEKIAEILHVDVADLWGHDPLGALNIFGERKEYVNGIEFEEILTDYGKKTIILNIVDKLNEEGQDKVIDYAQLLTNEPRFLKGYEENE